jgi:flagellar motor switch protein FliN/FliY
MHESVASFFDAFRDALEKALAEAGFTAEVAWRDPGGDTLPAELVWWSGNRGAEPAGAFLAGAEAETWEAIGQAGASGDASDAFAILNQCLETVLAARFGPAPVAGDSGIAEATPDSWTKAAIEIQSEEQSYLLYCLLSPALEAALNSGPTGQAPAPRPSNGAARSSLDLLMHVEVPVSVSFGRTRIRMKELLSLNPGSVVELDQTLGDEVEVWVNNCVIARGEVVAVDGNYGVRILELTSSAALGEGGNKK